jgi:hypothetical protein
MISSMVISFVWKSRSIPSSFNSFVVLLIFFLSLQCLVLPDTPFCLSTQRILDWLNSFLSWESSHLMYAKKLVPAQSSRGRYGCSFFMEHQVTIRSTLS